MHSVRCRPPQPSSLVNQRGLLCEGSPRFFCAEPNSVQSPPQLWRNTRIIFTQHLSVCAERHPRIALPETLPPNLERRFDGIKKGGVRMTQRMESRRFDTKLLEEQVQLALHQQIRVVEVAAHLCADGELAPGGRGSRRCGFFAGIGRA